MYAILNDWMQDYIGSRVLYVMLYFLVLRQVSHLHIDSLNLKSPI